MNPDQTYIGQGLHVWTGISGKKYRYSAFMFGTNFGPGAGNFIFAREIKPGLYFPVYIGHTPDLSEPFSDQFVLQCITLSRATHIHVRFNEADQVERLAECEDLIAQLQPPCNRRR